MAVKINRIHKPGEEMSDCKALIEAERRHRASYRLQADPDYVATQVSYVDEQIATLELQKAGILQRAADSPDAVAASFQLTRKTEARYAELKHRDKINRHDEIAEHAATLAEELRKRFSLSEELMAELTAGVGPNCGASKCQS